MSRNLFCTSKCISVHTLLFVALKSSSPNRMWQYRPGSVETCRNERLVYCSMYALVTLFLPVL